MTNHDAILILDVVLASLLTPLVKLITLKAFLEPAAFWAGRRGWRVLDKVLDDRLPDLK
jgi:hypothetical protein